MTELTNAQKKQFVTFVGIQNISPPNMPLRHPDFFELGYLRVGTRRTVWLTYDLLKEREISQVKDTLWASLLIQMVVNSPAMQETQVQSLGQKEALEKRMATHSSILAWRISWTEESGGLPSMGLQRVRHNWVTCTSLQNVPCSRRAEDSPGTQLYLCN